jgi:hypothetical protein
VNAETVTSMDEDGTIHNCGDHDDRRAKAVRAPDSGVIPPGIRSPGRAPAEAGRHRDDFSKGLKCPKEGPLDR